MFCKLGLFAAFDAVETPIGPGVYYWSAIAGGAGGGGRLYGCTNKRSDMSLPNVQKHQTRKEERSRRISWRGALYSW